jgi:xanthine dehydrogenase YagT iron-sulfur-binding subunit
MSRQKGQDVKPKTSPERLSRRDFLSQASTVGVAGAAVTLAGPMAAAVSEPLSQQGPVDGPTIIPGTVPVTLRVNGETHHVRIDPRATILDTLRETLNLTGTKKGCDHGQCGACTVHINGRRVNSCLTFAAMHQHDEITTIEGIGQPGTLNPMQAAFVEQDGFQCGYCTSGQIMSAVAMLQEPWGPEDKDVKEAMAGNICRCGAYPNIIAAVQQVRGNGRRNG